MKIGIIGAGKVGTSLGKLLAEGGETLVGFYSRSAESAAESAEFTGGKVYRQLELLVEDCEALLLTVPDQAITSVFQELRPLDLTGKYIGHCSGSISAGEAFPQVAGCGAKVFSIHPLFPVSSKFSCWQELKDGFFTLEGDEAPVAYFFACLNRLGARTKLIAPSDKVRYHAACVFSSNLVCGLIQQSLDLLADCDFTEAEALEALAPLVTSNITHVLNVGPAQALTGPIARGDAATVRKHLAVLDGDPKNTYISLSKELLRLSNNPSAEDFKFLSETFGDAGA